MKTVNQLVAEIKENGQDFEFYPTTEEIVRALKVHVKFFTREDYYHNEVKSILDIGCGNGAFFEKYCNDDNEDFKNIKKYGIEKWYSEKVSGKDLNRPKLQEMLDFVTSI